MRQELLVESGAIFRCRRRPVEAHVVGMHVDERHAAARRNPVELFLPDVDRRFPQHEKQRRVLRQRVRQLDVIRCAHLSETQNGKIVLHAVGLRLERIGVERRRVVQDVQVLQPVEVVQHEGRAKADRAPVVQVVVDSSARRSNAFRERYSFPSWWRSCTPTSNPASFRKVRSDGGVVYSPSGTKLNDERNPRSISSSASCRQRSRPRLPFDVVGQHEGELLAVGPAWPGVGAGAPPLRRSASSDPRRRRRSAAPATDRRIGPAARSARGMSRLRSQVIKIVRRAAWAHHETPRVGWRRLAMRQELPQP